MAASLNSGVHFQDDVAHAPSREPRGLWRMSRPRVAVVEFGGESVSRIGIGASGGFEQRFLHISREVSPLLKHRTPEK
jgi:hypothetical protein